MLERNKEGDKEREGERECLSHSRQSFICIIIVFNRKSMAKSTYKQNKGN